MGSKISIDKYVSQLEDILQLNPKNLEHVNLESKIPDSITQNIKIWKFYEEDSKPKKILNQAISLQDLQNSNNNTFVSFPHSMWGIVESYNNLTPRGLENPLSTSGQNLEILDSFLLPSQKNEKISLNFEHMIFVWNGKNSNPLIKSLALSSAYSLESLIEKGKDNILQIFFSGGVIVQNKLKNGKVIQLNSTSNKPRNKELEKEINKMSQTIFLFKFLFPLNSFRGTATSNCNSDGVQKQDNNNKKNQNWIKQDEYGNNYQNCNIQENGITNNHQNNYNSGEVINSPDNEYQGNDDANQQQFYSSSSVDSNTTAASETHYLKYFKKQFCDSNIPSYNYLNNFIRIPASSKKNTGGPAAKKFQETKLGYDNQQANEYEYYNQQQYQQQNIYEQQERNNQQMNNMYVEEELNQQQEQNNNNYNVYQAQNNQDQQQFAPPQQNIVPPFKMKPLNFAKMKSPIINDNNQYSMNKKGNGVFDDQNNYNQPNNGQNYPYDQDNQNQYIECGLKSGDPGVNINIHYGNVEEDPQEQNQIKYKNLNEMKDILNINMDLESAGEEPSNEQYQQQMYQDKYNNQFNKNYDDNSPNSYDNEEDENYVSDYPVRQQYNYNQNNTIDQPLPSHRGGYPSNQTNNSNIADLSKKKWSNLNLGNLNQSSNTGGRQAQNNDKNQNINKENDKNDLVDEIINIRKEEMQGENLKTNAKIKIFSQICSEVIENFLYVSGEEVANNLTKLKQNGITHIINCAGDVCKNTFPGQFTYKTYRLKDAKTENIECIFYDTIEFIEQVARENGRVFIHCVQGISRSITLSLAYIIWKQKKHFQDALTFVKQARDVASPNVGFIVQLIYFEKRLFEDYDSIKVRPRVWCVSSHQVEQPQLIVAKMLLERLYSKNKLDPRGVFIIQTEDKLIIWVGKDIPIERSQIYQDYALNYIENLRKYEQAPQTLEIVQQNEESEEFWQMWDMTRPEVPYQQNREWNNWFLDITQQIEIQEDDDEDDDDKRDGENGEQSKPKLFVYPDTDPLTMFDEEELCLENLCILCKEQEEQVKIFIWRGSKFMGSHQDQQQFLENIKQNHFPNQNYFEQNEFMGQESDEFMDNFFQN